MGLFDFIKQHHAKRLLHDLGSQTMAILGAVRNQARYIIGADIFVQVQPDQPALATKIDISQGLGKLSFTNTGWPQEQEGTDWAVLVAHASSGPAQCIAHNLDGARLVNHTLVNAVLKL